MKSNNSQVLISVILVLATILIGCAKRGTEVSDKVIIRYASWASLPKQRKLGQEVIGVFEAEYPDIQVKVEFAETPEKIIVEMAGGTAPDVFYWIAGDLAPLISKRTVLDLRPFIEEDKIDLSRFFSNTVKAVEYKGGIYAYPLHCSTQVLFYNKTMFDKAGIDYPDENWKWKDFLEAGIKLTKDLDGDGRIDQFGMLRPDYMSWIKLNGGKLFNEDRTKCLMDSPQAIEAVQFLADLDHKYHLVPVLITPLEQRREIPLFESGKIGMMVGMAYMLIGFKQIKNFEWDVAPVPYNKKRVVRLVVGGYSISSQSKHPKEAWEFVKFLSGERAQRILAKNKDAIPALRSVAESPAFSSPPPEHIKIFVDQVAYSEPYSSMMLKFDKFRQTIADPEITRVWLGQKSAEEACRTIVKKTDDLLSQN